MIKGEAQFKSVKGTTSALHRLFFFFGHNIQPSTNPLYTPTGSNSIEALLTLAITRQLVRLRCVSHKQQVLLCTEAGHRLVFVQLFSANNNNMSLPEIWNSSVLFFAKFVNFSVRITAPFDVTCVLLPKHLPICSDLFD